ncbi:hypothetical protein [Haladaptatus sp. DYSN1]|uniref:hypothetical protein n=1 Tax=unclassified Haladaptatus TaxID=2622732 RepID=UPI002406348B|nr:hypothetical protein [Haladaptatus sp. DYSN1]
MEALETLSTVSLLGVALAVIGEFTGLQFATVTGLAAFALALVALFAVMTFHLARATANWGQTGDHLVDPLFK